MAIGKINYPVAEINSLLGAIKQAPNIYATQSGVTQQITEATEGLASTTQVSEQIEEAIGNLTGKADIDGAYPQMTVGFAQEIVGDGSAAEEEFSFRPTAGEDRNVANTTYYEGERNGVARIEKVKGNSVVWNQGAYSEINTSSNGVNISISDSGIVELSGIANGNINIGKTYALVVNHIYLHRVEVLSMGAAQSFNFGNINEYDGRNTFTSAGVYEKTKKRTSYISSATIGFLNVAGVDLTGVKVCYRIYDLTQMFGAGNEPTTVEELYQRLPKGVETNAYNAGELVDGSYGAIKTVGFNAFNGTYAKVCGGCPYYLGGNYTSLGFATEEGGTTEAITLPTSTESVGTTPSDRLYTPTQDGYIYAEGENININLSWSTEYGYMNGTYQPYKPFERDLSWVARYFPSGMRSAGSVRDEIRFNSTTQKWEAVQNVGSRAYTSGDESNSAVTTDGTTTNYTLTTPIVTEIEDMPNMDFDVSDYGTEELIAQEGKASAPIVADIAYAPNALSTLKQVPDILARLKALEAAVASATSTTNMAE
ncbi:MAG: hypothetical protein J6U49_00865 [Alistipes sp.]|nr:hypothetical protein [Alistipes sp.]